TTGAGLKTGTGCITGTGSGSTGTGAPIVMDQLTSWACAAPTPSAPVATSAAAANSLLLFITHSPDVADHDGRPSTTERAAGARTLPRQRFVKLCEARARPLPAGKGQRERRWRSPEQPTRWWRSSA